MTRRGADWPPIEAAAKVQQPEERWDEVVDPDDVLTPCRTLRDKFITPIAEQMRSGSYFLRPAKGGVSFVIYGPPGSGKTYVVSQFAQALGWPLVSLSPGYFIAEGLESIEAVAGRSFGDLTRVDHAVVFFDECDELFRDRGVTDKVARNILSFATASMLPKLQKLHDSRKVKFVLGTNYVGNIDMAIRRPGRFDAILLFDRPDRTARIAIYKKDIADKRNIDIGSLVPADVSTAENAADATSGCMTKEVIAFVNDALARKTPSPPST